MYKMVLESDVVNVMKGDGEQKIVLVLGKKNIYMH